MKPLVAALVEALEAAHGLLDQAAAPSCKPHSSMAASSSVRVPCAVEPLVRLLRRVTVDAPARVQARLVEADPLPASLPGLQPASQLQHSLKAGVSLPAELCHFSDSVHGMTPASRGRALSALQEMLPSRCVGQQAGLGFRCGAAGGGV